MDTSKKKLCWNCEASVSRSLANCPYCGVYLHRSNEEDENEDMEEEGTFSEKADKDYKHDEDETTPSPPYLAEALAKEKHATPAPPYVKQTQEVPPTLAKGTPPEPPAKEDTTTIKYALVSLIALILGVVALLFSFILLFFSHHGVLTLRWNSDMWFLYLAISIPLLFVGWFSLKHIKD